MEPHEFTDEPTQDDAVAAAEQMNDPDGPQPGVVDEPVDDDPDGPVPDLMG